MIKNLKPKKSGHFKQGYYPIKESKKYVGKDRVIYRSNLERLFCDYCERSTHIKSWDSECLEIIYMNEGKEHRYYPDFLVKTIDDLVIVIEVKPLAQTKKPVPIVSKSKKKMDNYRKALETYTINMLKFQAALKYCADRGWVFRIITEDFFKK